MFLRKRLDSLIERVKSLNQKDEEGITYEIKQTTLKKVFETLK